MNRISLLFFIFIIQFFSVILFHNNLYSKDYQTDSFICAADSIPIIDNSGGGGGLNDPKSVGFVPIGCELLGSGIDLLFSFYDNLGNVTITVTNLSTCEVDSRIVDSQLGLVFFPISGNPGFYSIIINPSGGGTYYGHFTL